MILLLSLLRSEITEISTNFGWVQSKNPPKQRGPTWTDQRLEDRRNQTTGQQSTVIFNRFGVYLVQLSVNVKERPADTTIWYAGVRAFAKFTELTWNYQLLIWIQFPCMKVVLCTGVGFVESKSYNQKVNWTSKWTLLSLLVEDERFNCMTFLENIFHFIAIIVGYIIY